MSEKIKNKIIDKLKEVFDPEIPINVYDLGLIYDIKILKNKKCEILMTLTSETCPTADYIQMMIKDASDEIVGKGNTKTILTFDPKWTSNMVSREAKEELGLIDTNENFEEDIKSPIEKNFETDNFELIKRIEGIEKRLDKIEKFINKKT